jgi:hypothetical protein
MNAGCDLLQQLHAKSAAMVKAGLARRASDVSSFSLPADHVQQRVDPVLR